MALQSLLSLCPLPWLRPLPQGWGDNTQRNHSRNLSIHPTLSQGQPSSAPSQGWGPHEELPEVETPADARGSPGICLAA